MRPPSDLHTVAEIRQVEQAALAALPAGSLMQRAGNAAAQLALSLLAEAAGTARVLVFAGPGNNGGDALETASRLASAGVAVSVLLYADADKFPPDARQALQRARASAVHFADTGQLPEQLSKEWSLVVDGLFGIGLQRSIGGDMRAAVDAINNVDCPAVLALDVPSGLDADTGNIVGGANGVAVCATHTITFIADKPGLHTAYGRDHAGEVAVDSLQIDHRLFPSPHAWLNGVPLFAGLLRPRRQNSHKGSFGDVAIIGGSRGMAGAAILAARAAAKSGAGRVFAAFIEDPPTYDSLQPELMCRLAHDLDFDARTLVAGPGLGTSDKACDALKRTLSGESPLVLDADALNLIAADGELQQMASRRSGMTVMTPHPLEAARLLASSSSVVQADRLAAARKLAERFNAVIVLKGSGTVIARPDSAVAINTTGNPGLATAGTGDVLAGICGALLAQGWPGWEAALAATWLHGHAADLLVTQGVGPVGLTAGELIPCVRAALNRLISER